MILFVLVCLQKGDASKLCTHHEVLEYSVNLLSSAESKIFTRARRLRTSTLCICARRLPCTSWCSGHFAVQVLLEVETVGVLQNMGVLQNCAHTSFCSTAGLWNAMDRSALDQHTATTCMWKLLTCQLNKLHTCL